MAYLGLTRLDRAGERLLAAGLAGGEARPAAHPAAGARAARPRPPRRGQPAPGRSAPAPRRGRPVAGPHDPRAHPHPDRLDRRRTAPGRRSRASRADRPPARAARVRTRWRRSASARWTGPRCPAPARAGDRARLRRVRRQARGLDLARGVRAVKERDGTLEDNGSFDATLGARPDRVTSLVFLDFSQLLQLGERTGLSDSRSYGRSARTSAR